MNFLTPQEASLSAANVYQVIDGHDVPRYFDVSLKKKFDLQEESRFDGVAGASIFRYKSGFGVFAPGIDQHENEALLAIRGTEYIVRDLLLTDLNIGLQRTTTGMWVHAGFNKVFKSFEEDILRFCDKHNPMTVHCVGHSLGGGLATMAADFLSYTGLAKPILYTFGSPRVGGEDFARRLTGMIGQENIFRVYHKSDIVSMVPLWPFMHIPQPGTECYVDSPGIPWVTYHGMEKYISSCSHQTWTPLVRKEPTMNFDNEIRNWLLSPCPLMMSYHSMVMASKALAFILKKILHAAGIAVQTLIIHGLTFIDALAMVLHKGAQATKEVMGYVKGLVYRLMSMINVAVETGKDVTLELIRWVLVQFMRSVYRTALMALETVHRR